LFWYDTCRSLFLAAEMQPELEKIAGCPTWEFAESQILSFILRTPARRVGGFVGCF
jgi:hypothetical protein